MQEPIAQTRSLLEPGTLWARVVDRTQQALRRGALLSIPTVYEFVEQGGIRFLVRSLANLARKDAAKQQSKAVAADGEFNPFLPYEEDLFVAELSETHVCLLNKFNVADHHLLIITRAFEEQETWLTLQDFQAMWMCLAEIEGLVFYNAGKNAGASQRHKHLQLVPLPLTPEGPAIPIAPLLPSIVPEDAIITVPELPFVHAFTTLDSELMQSPLQAAAVTFERYQNLLRTVGLQNDGNSNRQSGAYNLLATREWMLLVPRSQESFDSISVNSLGFAGTLFVRNQQQMELLKQYGPLSILKQVGMGW